jgi:hypothetical protein
LFCPSGRYLSINLSDYLVTGRDILDQTLKQLGFPNKERDGTIIPEEILNQTLRENLLDRSDGMFRAAATNWERGIVYLNSSLILQRIDLGETVAHEMLHVIFKGGHSLLARDLGLGDFSKEEDGLASAAIVEWLANGCH